ncbi:MBOAT family O-acyltransferase [Amantichitinum ursilacus]|uniref:Probable alginate O-acetylase AlgI n=1 Tax=Amantichitinum ursilacus TaxID=857265 RepID=A0A0N1JTS6_9NEIS|nr:MBOAT family protein [Amantichitinum ursilacus]KPC54488.1 Peptidoglycan O-acetyltransferase [Amantichitinum ursilacus]
MVFSSPVFLFLFLPLTLALYYLLARSYRNVLLLCASLLFYAWGEPVYVLLMLASIAFNWLVGIAVEATAGKRISGWILGGAVGVNLLVLAHYKYAFFLASAFNSVAIPLFHFGYTPAAVTLPLGISFFTFHAISYIVDVHRKQAHALKSPLDMGVYISLFPQLVAGPIIRFHDIAEQIQNRTNTMDRFCSGIERFSFGLGKKVLIANTMGQIADQAFAVTPGELSTPVAWLGVFCYTLQIYFDFSGYSDMAIGLARMFGFELTENFNYPYIARSVREFWRRWHLSLSTWFRDYLYIPLGGNRASPARVKFNLFTVFFLCGLWHGASWNFVLWGIFHGALLVLERGRLGRWVDALPRWAGHIYTLLLIMFGWVFFRADTLPHALAWIGALVGFSHGHGLPAALLANITSVTLVTAVLGMILSTPIATSLCRDWKSRIYPPHAAEPYPPMVARVGNGLASLPGMTVSAFASLGILLLCAAQLAASTYNPFIYFRF